MGSAGFHTWNVMQRPYRTYQRPKCFAKEESKDLKGWGI